MEIYRPIDVENAIVDILSEHLKAYCAPLPADFETPCILVTAAGGATESTNTGKGKIDSFTVVIDSRHEINGDALEYLRTAIAILEQSRGSGIAHVEVNSMYSWGVDPVRPDLSMCSATLIVTAHREVITI